jgi:DNA polymerase-3 subunit delta
MNHYKEVVKSLEQGRFAPVYLLDGEEPFYIDLLLRYFEDKIIPPEEQDFNLITLYGKETNWRDVMNAARRYPMFSDKLLVILKEASQMKDLNDLAAYIENPNPTTILVIEHRFKKLDARGKLAKLAGKNGVYFTSEKIKEEQVPHWITEYAASLGTTIGEREAGMLTAYLGNDLQKIANDIGKVLINETELQVISAAQIEQYIGISREYNVMELPDALFEGNQARLAAMLNYFTANPKAAPMPFIIGLFYTYLQKLYLCYVTKENFQEDRKLGIWTKHRKMARQLSLAHVHQGIALLEIFSHKAVGIDSVNKDELLKEMVGRMSLLLKQSA